MIQFASVTLEDARRILTAGEARATEIGVPCNIAVVDAGAHLVAHIRMDGSQLGSITHAIDKAFTSCAYRRTTEALGRDGQPAGPLYGVANTHQGRVVVFAGGIPLVHEGQVVGAIGVSGGTIEEDRTVAEAAVAAF
ncbi:heme-binding protein [Streptomyces sp. NPDC056500]|uniref:GlcG/HbpS family heme-binding protein n=1 Tax=Streptomyces sp. NPDC056500 TaxID=3345840 RepID=UPI003694EFDA